MLSRTGTVGLGATLTIVGVFAFWPHPVQVPLSEAMQHFVAFAGLAMLWRAAVPRVSAAHIGVCLVALGGLIEILQWLFTSRHAEWRDLTWDAVGAMAALGVLEAFRPRAYGVAGNSSR